jgi:hypothetical protein
MSSTRRLDAGLRPSMLQLAVMVAELLPRFSIAAATDPSDSGTAQTCRG